MLKMLPNLKDKTITEKESKKETLARCVNEIIVNLIKAHKERKDVNLNRLKCDIASKYGMNQQPKLVDIIAAVPSDYKVFLKYKILFFILQK